MAKYNTAILDSQDTNKPVDVLPDVTKNVIASSTSAPTRTPPVQTSTSTFEASTSSKRVLDRNEARDANDDSNEITNEFLSTVAGKSSGYGVEAAEGTQYSWNTKASDTSLLQYQQDAAESKRSTQENNAALMDSANTYLNQTELGSYVDNQTADKMGWVGKAPSDINRQREYMQLAIEANLYTAADLQKAGYASQLAQARFLYEQNLLTKSEELWDKLNEQALLEAKDTGVYVSPESREMLANLSVANETIKSSTNKEEVAKAKNIVNSINQWFETNNISKQGIVNIETYFKMQDTLKESAWLDAISSVDATKTNRELSMDIDMATKAQSLFDAQYSAWFELYGSDKNNMPAMNSDGSYIVSNGKISTKELDKMTTSEIKDYISINTESKRLVYGAYTNIVDGAIYKYVNAITSKDESGNNTYSYDKNTICDKLSGYMDKATVKKLFEVANDLAANGDNSLLEYMSSDFDVTFGDTVVTIKFNESGEMGVSDAVNNGTGGNTEPVQTPNQYTEEQINNILSNSTSNSFNVSEYTMAEYGLDFNSIVKFSKNIINQSTNKMHDDDVDINIGGYNYDVDLYYEQTNSESANFNDDITKLKSPTESKIGDFQNVDSRLYVYTNRGWARVSEDAGGSKLRQDLETFFNSSIPGRWSDIQYSDKLNAVNKLKNSVPDNIDELRKNYNVSNFDVTDKSFTSKVGLDYLSNVKISGLSSSNNANLKDDDCDISIGDSTYHVDLFFKGDSSKQFKDFDNNVNIISTRKPKPSVGNMYILDSKLFIYTARGWGQVETDGFMRFSGDGSKLVNEIKLIYDGTVPDTWGK